MVSLDDLRELVLYKKPFFLPIDPKNKKYNSAILLLSPTYKASIVSMTKPYMINRLYFESYYMEKNITYLIQNEMATPVSYETPISEEKLETKDRNNLETSEFGLPKQRKYPLNDKDHILLAIRFFNHCPNEDRDELARNILKAIGKKFTEEEASEIHVGEKNAFFPYWQKSKYYKQKTNEDALSEGLFRKKSLFKSILGLNSIPIRFSNDLDDFFPQRPDIIDTSNRSIAFLTKQMTSNYSLSGNSSDIAVVSRYLHRDSIEACFVRMNRIYTMPKHVTLFVTSDFNVPETFSETSVVVYTPFALEQIAPQVDYRMYLQYILQLYAVYTLKPKDGRYYTKPGRVMDSIAEPAAIVLSGAIDNGTILNRKNALYLERLFKWIIAEHGIDHFIDIVASNDVKTIYKYSAQYMASGSYAPSDFSYKVSNILKEDGEQSAAPASNQPSKPAAPSLPKIEIPDSIKKIKNYSRNMKRKMREPIYKLNKLVKDIKNQFPQAQAPSSSSTPSSSDSGEGDTAPSTEPPATDNNAESIKKEHLMKYTGDDYILEGDYIYLFEDSPKYDSMIKKALYKDRIKNNKQVIQMYKRVKADCPFIKYTFVDLKLYKNRNLFVDLSYYNESFFRNVTMLNDADKVNPIRIFNMYMELLARLLKDNKLSSYNKKTIFIPILEWRHNDSSKMWMYKEDINPISAIYHMIKYNPAGLKKIFGDRDVIFLGGNNYFKVNFSHIDFSSTVNRNKFLLLTQRIIALGYNMTDPDPAGELADSPSGIAMDIINKIEKSQKVSIDDVSKISALKTNSDIFSNSKKDSFELDINLRKDTSNAVKKPAEEEQPDIKDTSTLPVDTKPANATSEKDKKDKIVDAVAQAADGANSVDDAMKKLDNDSFKEMILALQNDSEENIRVSKAQASTVINAQSEFHKKQLAGKSVEDLLKVDLATKELPTSQLKVASINEDWQNMTFMNFDKDYDLNSDIVKMLDSMQHWTFPIAVKNIDIKDNSTSEDIVDLWKIECIDFRKSRFTLKVDVPKFINGSNFLKLRGNEKALMIQSTLFPIIKTGLDECQIIGSGGYNKIFVRKFGSRVGQSLPTTGRLLRALNKYESEKHRGIKIVDGDNTKICSKYELPIDYIDLSQAINSIEVKDAKIYFNQDELRKDYEVDDTIGVPFAVMKAFENGQEKKVVRYFTGKKYNTITKDIVAVLYRDDKFKEIYESTGISTAQSSYSKASILNKEIPIVLICGYLEGLITTMNKANIQYWFEQKLQRGMKYDDQTDYIKFKDGYLIYSLTYSSSLLMNGLKNHDTESYSLKDMNNRMMYSDFFNQYGNFIEDGLENSYDCMIDPITKEILERCKLPTDYVSVLIYASNLLADNKYAKHIDQAGRRWRRKELIAGYFYKALTTAYQDYSRSLRNSRKGSKMEIKQSAIIDLIVSKDPAMSDLSINTAINDVECANTVTNKGLVGLNVARGYTISTRGYDDSMLNLLGMDTGFSGNVGVNRQATINANIEGGRGFTKTIDGNTDKLSVASTLTMTEAITPFGITHDDPQRTLMTYIQTSKHMVRTDSTDPTLITTGADEALPYLSSDIFAHKAKKDGKVVELVQEGFGKQNYMIIEYKDKTHEIINLSEAVKKNSDGGYFVPLKLDTDLSKGKTFKAGEVLAYDKLSFSNSLGESGNLAANIGTLAKIAIINTDEGFEDAAQVSEDFASRLGTQVVMEIEARIEKGSNIFVNKDIGDDVMEGDTLFSYQTDFDDDVANTLLKNLTLDTDQVSELGKNPIKSKYTGIVEDIIVYRTCELDEMSESLQKFVKKHENKINKLRQVYKKYNVDDSVLQKTEKVPEVGKTKHLDNAVMIIYYIKFTDKLSVGDKIVFYSANKGVIKYLVPRGKEPYTDFRPNEKIDSFMSLSSVSGRMTCSTVIFTAVSKLMVELDRSIKDLAGIPYDDSRV